MPWWGAVLIAVTLTLAGLAVEAGSAHQELGSAFAIGYSLGCVIAVLAVRQSGIFTAVIQPPLLLFVAVPLAYYLFHTTSFSGLKEVAITCGYPLIERFPLMLFTTSAVLLIGLVRWYLAMAHPAGPPASVPAEPRQGGLLAGLSTRISSAFAGNGSADERPGQRAARPRHVVDRPAAGRRRKPAAGSRASSRSRTPRPVEDFEPPRHRRESARRRPDEREYDSHRRRPREPRENREPREYREPRRAPQPPPRRREPRPHREYPDLYPPRPAGTGRYDPYDAGRGYQPNPVYPPYEPDPRRRPVNGAGATHHPVSRVRYRGAEPSDGDRDDSRHGSRY